MHERAIPNLLERNLTPLPRPPLPSLLHRYVRYIANLLGVIPVERPQDGTVKGTGRVTPSPDDRSLLLGLGTRFRTEVKPGDTIAWAAEGGRRAGGSKGVVAEVVSDEAVRLKGAAPNPRGGQAGMWAAGEEAATRSVLSGMAEGDAFKITPHIDQVSIPAPCSLPRCIVF
jgi:glycerol-3-phosphate O-acyltransferase/dihydroxyacetone phosphate acyltransferase